MTYSKIFIITALKKFIYENSEENNPINDIDKIMGIKSKY